MVATAEEAPPLAPWRRASSGSTADPAGPASFDRATFLSLARLSGDKSAALQYLLQSTSSALTLVPTAPAPSGVAGVAVPHPMAHAGKAIAVVSPLVSGFPPQELSEAAPHSPPPFGGLGRGSQALPAQRTSGAASPPAPALPVGSARGSRAAPPVQLFGGRGVVQDLGAAARGSLHGARP